MTTTDISDCIEVFDKRSLARKRRALVQELVTQERALAAIKAELSAPVDGNDGGENRGDNGERSGRIASRGEAESLEREVSARLLELESAIARLDRGDYGRCTKCGAAIDVDRLDAMPAVALCATCKSAPVSLITARSGLSVVA